MLVRRYEFYVWVARIISLAGHKNIKFVCSSWCVTFFLFYRHADGGIFDNFLKINFWPLSKDFRRFSKTCSKVTQMLLNIFSKICNDSKITEDYQRLLRKTWSCFDDTPMNLSTILRDKLDISEIIKYLH